MDEKRAPSEVIFGRNSVQEAIAAGRTINKIFYLESGDNRLWQLVKEAKNAKIPCQAVPYEQLERLAQGLRHQGIAAELAAKDYADWSKCIERLAEAGKQALVLVLDSIQDGHNLGAILRTADAAKVDLVVIPKRRGQALDARVSRASAGAIEFVPVARVANLSQAIRELQSVGFWIYGLAAEGSEVYDEVDYADKTALLIGNEGRGIAQKLREHCDYLLSIPMYGQINSLNASVACALATFAARRSLGSARFD
ncbi:MAG: 23S rRNA (guanosine(2251)-2'-O)-methyltransferase RlmB [Eubacteriales bacterium]|nr:23S rRNA (guanosine(2251)-2'-O)-methyltransferase RlmB [Eubacteriales bacterium]